MNKNCLIIEDQLPAQRILEKYIGELPNLNLIATCTDALSALKILQQQSIDLLFLDINLPKISGLNFLRSLHSPPKVIITTAYPEYAVEGFELDVSDYLLKPFSFERFLKAVSKVLFSESSSPTLSNPITEENFVFVKADKIIYRINFDEILYLKSDGDFIHIFTTQRKYFLSQTLKYWNAILPHHQFLQIHKSYIISLSKIISIQGNEIRLKNAQIPIGRSFKKDLMIKIEELMG